MTMTKLEYEAKIRDLERQLIELKQAKVDDENDIPQPPHQRWKPENGEMYRFIDDWGNVAALHWSGDQFDLRHFDVGNMFKMNDDAAFAIERLKVLAQIREWAGNWDDPWRIIYYGVVTSTMTQIDDKASFGELRFKTKKDAENCIKAVGEDRLIKYYFGVRDHEIPAETE